MSNSSPQQQVQKVQKCIEQSNSVLQDMQNLIQNTDNIEIKSSLKEAMHHLEMSIHECKYASQATL